MQRHDIPVSVPCVLFSEMRHMELMQTCTVAKYAVSCAIWHWLHLDGGGCRVVAAETARVMEVMIIGSVFMSATAHLHREQPHTQSRNNTHM